MNLCIETLCIRNRQILNLSAHVARFNRTRQALWNCSESTLLETAIQLPDWLLASETYKCRVTYGPTIQKIEFEVYHVRPVQSLILLDYGDLDYRFKYANRQPINDLFAQRGNADDVLMVRNGLLTDTSYANIALFDGNRWLTPAQPLLEGTQRTRLLSEGILTPANISPADLATFQSIKLVNAMLDWEHSTILPASAVSW